MASVSPIAEALLALLDACAGTAISPAVSVIFTGDSATLRWTFPNGITVLEVISEPLIDHAVRLQDAMR